MSTATAADADVQVSDWMEMAGEALGSTGEHRYANIIGLSK